VTTPTVPAAPPLARIPNVELMHVGEWEISTGTAYFTADDLALAVAASDCPAVRRPVLKLGHVDPRFDGEPAVGFIDNMAVAESGSTLVGDYAGMPGWLGQVVASAYPDRSIEGRYDFACQLGHTHPFVITAVALLGVTAPGIGTLQSLQDIAGLYGVAAAAETTGPGTPVTVTVRAAAQEARMPNPRPLQVAASVTTDDVRRAYYETAPWSVWIEEMELPQGDSPMTLLTVDDATREYARVTVIIGEGDGEDAVSFGDPVQVIRQFVEVSASVAASSAAGRVVFASRAESRPGQPPAPQTPAAAPAPGSAAPVQRGAGMDPAKLREAFDLPADASDIEVGAAIAAAGFAAPAAPAAEEPAPAAPATPTPAAPAAAPDGVVQIDASALSHLREQAAAGAAAREQQRVEARDREIDAAVNVGKFPPARAAHYAALWDKDPDGTKEFIDNLQPGLVPLAETGHSENDPTVTAASVRETPAYKNWSM
jgi:hypothetical protein